MSDSDHLERCDRPRRQLVVWSAVLLFLTLVVGSMQSISTLELQGAASLLGLVENPTVIPACLVVVILYFCFRLLVEWRQVPSQTRQKTHYRADFVVTYGIAWLSLIVFILVKTNILNVQTDAIIPAASVIAALITVFALPPLVRSMYPRPATQQPPTPPPAGLKAVPRYLVLIAVTAALITTSFQAWMIITEKGRLQSGGTSRR